MLFEAKLVSEDFFENDPENMGSIRIFYNNKIRWARPNLPYGTFYVPTLEWIKKYAKVTDTGSAIGVYVQNVNNSNRFVWTGFCIYKDQLPPDAMKNYAYRRVTFTDNWIEYYDDKKDENAYVIKHIDGTIVTIDRTTNSEMIKIFDGKFNHQILLDKNGVSITDGVNGSKFVTTNQGIELDDNTGFKVKVGSTTITVSGGGSTSEIDTPSLHIKGLSMKIDGTVIPTGHGSFCALPNCILTGAPHVGEISNNNL